MKLVKTTIQFFKNLFSKKIPSEIKKEGSKSQIESEEIKTLKSKLFVIKFFSVTFKYLKKFIRFILNLIHSIMKPMIKISKKHPIAFWVAVILHASLLFALLYANVERWDPPEQNSSTLPTAPSQAVVIDMEIIEAEQDRLKDAEKQKQKKLKTEEKRSETAKKDQKVAEQEALKAKAQKVFAEVKRKAEEAKTKEAEILASKANEIIAEAKTKTKIEEAKAKEAEVKRIAEEAKTKEAETLVKEATKQIAEAEAKRKKEEVKTKLAEIKRMAEEAKTQEAEILAKEANAVVKEAEDKRIAEELKAEKATKEFETSEAKRIAEELKVKVAESKLLAAELKTREAEVKRDAIEAKTKEAEQLVQEASKKLEEDKQQKDLFELEIAKLKEEQERIEYNRMLTQDIQDEQDEARSIIIADQLTTLKTAYVNNIAARVKTFWRYQAAEDNWSAEVYVVQDRNGKVVAVDVRNANVGGSSEGKSFMDSIERAVYKASPLPAAPDDAVFDKELIFIFSVN